jgi:hypothetical protein
MPIRQRVVINRTIGFSLPELTLNPHVRLIAQEYC